MKEIQIQLITKNNMIYTWAKINKDVQEVVEHMRLNDDLDNALENVCSELLQDLKRELEENKFVLSLFDKNILRVDEIKEVSVSYI